MVLLPTGCSRYWRETLSPPRASDPKIGGSQRSSAPPGRGTRLPDVNHVAPVRPRCASGNHLQKGRSVPSQRRNRGPRGDLASDVPHPEETARK